MSPDEIVRLVEAYREGTIGPDDARRLSAAIREGGDAARRIRRELELSGFLAQALEGDDGTSFERSFAERVTAEKAGSEFVSALERRAFSRGTRRPAATPAKSWILPAAAAAAVFLALVTAAFLAPRRARVEPAPPEQARHEEPPSLLPEAPAPAPDPVPPNPSPAPQRVVPQPEPSKPPAVPRPEPPPKPEEKPSPPPPVEEPRPAPRPTEVVKEAAVAVLERVEGQVFVVAAAGRRPAAAGEGLHSGTGVAVSGRAGLVFGDGTRVTLAGETVVREISRGPKGTRIQVSQGVAMADVARQPIDQPLVFVTPHGEARVLGTVLKLVVEGASTRLEVSQGRVRLTREGRSVEVAAGQFAVAGAAGPQPPRALHPEEIVLLPRQAKLTGNEWAFVPDPKSSTGVVLEAGATTFQPVDHVDKRPAFASFSFFASADREYRLWVRATSAEKGDAWHRDLVTLEPLRARMSQRSAFFGTAPTSAYVFTGLGNFSGYAWLSGHGEEAKVDGPPLTVRFAETGIQTLKIYVAHPHIRIDAIWLSATQRTRPPAKQLPPAESK